jgi:hypothetical protein
MSSRLYVWRPPNTGILEIKLAQYVQAHILIEDQDMQFSMIVQVSLVALRNWC